jgi:hypothetical protein
LPDGDPASEETAAFGIERARAATAITIDEARCEILILSSFFPHRNEANRYVE